jgi:preprotein translocase subunit SecG
MDNLQLSLLILQVVIAVIMIILVLLQKSDGDSLGGIGGGSGGLNSAISSKATANILSKITMVLIAIFMLNCLLLASLSKSSNKKIISELEQVIEEENSDPTAVKTPKAPTVPTQ